MAGVSGLDEFDWDSIVLHFPTAEEEERIKRFQVHRNYLLNIAMFLNDRHPEGVGPGVLAEQRALPGFRRIQRRKVTAEADIRRFLNIAWASELQLRLPELGERGFLRYSNAWTPVHAYYAVYMSMQAWFASMGLKLVNDHTSTLRTIANHVQRGVFPVPWTVTADGCPQLHECGFAGLPDGIDATAHVELLENPYLETFWPRLCKMLETTRKIRLERNLTEWKAQNNRKAMRKDEKRRIASRLLPTTIFDFFWRDVETILLSPVSDEWQSDFWQSLTTVTDATCLLLQSLLVQQLGRKPFAATADEFLRRDAGAMAPSRSWLSAAGFSVATLEKLLLQVVGRLGAP